MAYSHSYIDLDTGEEVDVYDDEPAIYRNAVIRTQRGTIPTGGTYGGYVPTNTGMVPGVRRPPRRVSVATSPAGRAVHARPAPYAQPTSEHFTINKGMIADVIPMVGEALAAFMGRPEMPSITGNDVIDRENAALHRDALAAHAQNQERIRAVTKIGAQIFNAFTRR